MSRYRRPDKHFQDCCAALTEKPKRRISWRCHAQRVGYEVPTRTAFHGGAQASQQNGTSRRFLHDALHTIWCTFDPPYRGCDTKTYKALPDEEYHALVKLLLKAPYKWIMSEYPNEIYQPLTDKFGSPLEKPVIKHGTRPGADGKRPSAIECLWANYDIRGILCPEGTVDINHAIEQLEKRREEIDVAIRVLKSELGNDTGTAIRKGKPSGSPAGRHSKTAKKHGRQWTPEAREAMSARLKASWANRKKGKKTSAATA